MSTLFFFCATIGGTIVVIQFLMTMTGLGGDALDFDIPDDIDLDVDAGFDVDASDHSGTHIFGILSFRSVTAAVTFFGLGGMLAQSMDWGPVPTVGAAGLSGFGAMYVVYRIMMSLQNLNADGTARIRNAVGHHATVYTTIPERGTGTGKIQINLQDRTMEYFAETTGDTLVPGARVVVTELRTPDTVAVEMAHEEIRDDHA